MGMLDSRVNLEEGSHVKKSHERGLGVHCTGRRLGPDIRATELLTAPSFRYQNLGADRRLVANGPFVRDVRYHGCHDADCVEFVGCDYLFLFVVESLATKARPGEVTEKN